MKYTLMYWLLSLILTVLVGGSTFYEKAMVSLELKNLDQIAEGFAKLLAGHSNLISFSSILIWNEKIFEMLCKENSYFKVDEENREGLETVLKVATLRRLGKHTQNKGVDDLVPFLSAYQDDLLGIMRLFPVHYYTMCGNREPQTGEIEALGAKIEECLQQEKGEKAVSHWKAYSELYIKYCENSGGDGLKLVHFDQLLGVANNAYKRLNIFSLDEAKSLRYYSTTTLAMLDKGTNNSERASLWLTSVIPGKTMLNHFYQHFGDTASEVPEWKSQIDAFQSELVQYTLYDDVIPTYKAMIREYVLQCSYDATNKHLLSKALWWKTASFIKFIYACMDKLETVLVANSMSWKDIGKKEKQGSTKVTAAKLFEKMMHLIGSEEILFPDQLFTVFKKFDIITEAVFKKAMSSTKKHTRPKSPAENIDIQAPIKT